MATRPSGSFNDVAPGAAEKEEGPEMVAQVTPNVGPATGRYNNPDGSKAPGIPVYTGHGKPKIG